jgi:hypothetical protein
VDPNVINVRVINLFDGFQSFKNSTFDLDTYDTSSDLVGQSDAFDATARFNSRNDLVLLMAGVFSVDNKALADIDATLNEVGLFTQNTTDGGQLDRPMSSPPPLPTQETFSNTPLL